MNILGLDTAHSACSAALLVDGKLAAHRFELMRVGHAERLMGQISEVLEGAGRKYSDLDRIACTIGPGTFTGTRIALSAARGLAIGLRIPVIGVTTFEALAAAMSGEGVRVAVFDAKRGELYLQAFAGDALAPLTAPEALTIKAAAQRINGLGRDDLTIGGTGAELLQSALAGKGVLSEASPVPEARFVAQLAVMRDAPSSPPSPLYLRPPDADLPPPTSLKFT